MYDSYTTFPYWLLMNKCSSYPGVTPTMSSIAFSLNLKTLITIYANTLTILGLPY